MTTSLTISPVLRALALAVVALALLLAAAPASALPHGATKRELLLREKERRALVRGARAASIARSVVGTSYRWGGSSTAGFDCSGLVMWAYGHVGLRLPHHAGTLATRGTRVPTGRLRPGDLLFFRGYGHVGIYLGRGRMVHAPQSGERVEVVRLASRYGRRLVEARRVVA